MTLDELGTYLEDAGVGVLGSTLYLGGVPLDVATGPVQDSLLALIEVPGFPPLDVHSDVDASIEQPVIQLVSRGAPQDYHDAASRVAAAYLALEGLCNQVLSGTLYLEIWAQQPPLYLKQDDLGRHYITFTVRCQKSLT